MEAILTAEAVRLVGTSMMVTTPAGLLRYAAQRQVPIVEVNPDPALPHRDAAATDAWGLPAATATLPGPAGEVLPRLLTPAADLSDVPQEGTA